ncbi:unnamed protein product [Rotaria magnacalcarata]|uniref:Uncharacterized protein n=1 Tax=Rotaria magnacalcarata TaxID=392030 RepID=A0A8S3ANW4_9BILA|nr:unnamed protein product [Rotaria magnacalcarata]
MKSHQPINEQPMSMTQHPMQGAAKFSAKSTKDAKEWLEDLASSPIACKNKPCAYVCKSVCGRKSHSRHDPGDGLVFKEQRRNIRQKKRGGRVASSIGQDNSSLQRASLSGRRTY